MPEHDVDADAIESALSQAAEALKTGSAGEAMAQIDDLSSRLESAQAPAGAREQITEILEELVDGDVQGAQRRIEATLEKLVPHMRRQ